MANDFRSFEELSQSIKRSGDKWIAANVRADRNTQYIGQWEALTRLDAFVRNERKMYEEELERMKTTYAPKFLEEKRQKLAGELNALVESTLTEIRKNVKALAEKKQQKVIDMLTATPSAEQVRLLNVLNMRGNLESVEMQYILPSFFGNYQAMQVFAAVCQQNGVRLTMPAQLDCRVMFDNIKNATAFLLDACDEVLKPKDKRNVKYHAFFTVDPARPNDCLDPYYMDFVEVLDTIPQLNDCKTEKTGLTPVEQAQLDWYYRDADKGNENHMIAYTEMVITEHPELKELLKYTPYARHLEIIAMARAAGDKDA